MKQAPRWNEENLPSRSRLRSCLRSASARHRVHKAARRSVHLAVEACEASQAPLASNSMTLAENGNPQPDSVPKRRS
eukprot:2491092-Pleurochrysis_carterae.AAC.2